MSQIDNEAQAVCIFYNAPKFTQFINALRPFTKRINTNYIMIESDGKKIIGYACDGYRFAVQVYSGECTVVKPFRTYLLPPRINPEKDDGPVKLFQQANGDALLYFNGIYLTTKKPNAPMDFHKLYESLQVNIEQKIAVNRTYLREAAVSLYSSDRLGSKDNVVIEIGGSNKPVKLSNGENERYIMPIRMRD